MAAGMNESVVRAIVVEEIILALRSVEFATVESEPESEDEEPYFALDLEKTLEGMIESLNTRMRSLTDGQVAEPDPGEGNVAAPPSGERGGQDAASLPDESDG